MGRVWRSRGEERRERKVLAELRPLPGCSHPFRVSRSAVPGDLPAGLSGSEGGAPHVQRCSQWCSWSRQRYPLVLHLLPAQFPCEGTRAKAAVLLQEPSCLLVKGNSTRFIRL